MAQKTRELAKENALTIWLKADVETLYHRTAGRKHRPFLMGADSLLKEKLESYINEEYPYYSEADIVVETKNERVEHTVSRVVKAINTFYSGENKNEKK